MFAGQFAFEKKLLLRSSFSIKRLYFLGFKNWLHRNIFDRVDLGLMNTNSIGRWRLTV